MGADPPLRPHGEGGTHPCAGGAAGTLHTLQERDTLSSGTWVVLGAHPLPPAHQEPRFSHRMSPILLSRHLPHQ